MKQPLIFQIKGNSLDDGPGIRTVIFFKGCPLSCVWCHNPEGMKPGFEHFFNAGECIRCLTCVELCNRDAISYIDNLNVDKSKCLQCFTCVSACPTGALEIIGKSIGIEKITEQVIKDKPFFDTSGGGVTLSGGEPTLYMDFCSELLKELKKNNIHTLLETCGFFDMEDFREKMLPLLDSVYFDIKLFDGAEHRKYCGVDNEVILENFRALSLTEIELMPRVPLVPGITDAQKNLCAIASFLSECGIRKVKLLPYNPLWPDKMKKFGRDISGVASEMRQFLKPERIEECRANFLKAGIQPV